MASRGDSLVEVDAFLSKLARSVLGILVGLILHHLHSLATFALFVAVLADHVQLADAVLQDRTANKRIRYNCRAIIASVSVGEGHLD